MLTSGVSLVVGLVFVGITAAAGGGGAMAEANYLRSKGKTSIVVASTTLDEARAWKTILEVIIAGGPYAKDDLDGDDGSIWSALFADEEHKIRAAEVLGGPLISKGPATPGIGSGGKSGTGVAKDKSSQLGQRGTTGGTLHQLHHETPWRPLEGGWVMLLGCGVHGLRIFREERDVGREAMMQKWGQRRRLSVEGRSCPPLRSHIVVNSTPLNAFMCLMSHSRIDGHVRSGRGEANTDQPDGVDGMLTPNSCQRASFRVIESIDDHMDIIHLFFRPVYLFPSWTAPRDYVLFRYWRFDSDGSYMVCLDSVRHRSCPPIPGYVRGELYGVHTIAPQKRRRAASGRGVRNDQTQSECLLTSLVQVDPKGWVPVTPLSLLSNQSYAEAFGVSTLLQVLDVRDALDYDRFVSVPLDDATVKPPHWKEALGEDADLAGSASSLIRQQNHNVSLMKKTVSPRILHHSNSESKFIGVEQSRSVEFEEDEVNYDFSYSFHEKHQEEDSGVMSIGQDVPRSISTQPEPLPSNCWAEPDSNSFRVRGKKYKTDGKKINAGPSLFRLVAVDIVEVEENIYTGMCAHPSERVQQSLARGDLPPFIFAVNVALPGPPCYHMMFYFAVDDISLIDGTSDNPFSKLARDFFFSDSDEFRNKTFKLIPQVVEGNFIVRKAVGSTPCIMGTKIKLVYIRDPSPEPRYFELILDIASDSVAKGVIRLCLGYAKSIVVDLAFLLEGTDESTLPERVMGCIRLKNAEFTDLRFVEAP